MILFYRDEILFKFWVFFGVVLKNKIVSVDKVSFDDINNNYNKSNNSYNIVVYYMFFYYIKYFNFYNNIKR